MISITQGSSSSASTTGSSSTDRGSAKGGSRFNLAAQPESTTDAVQTLASQLVRSVGNGKSHGVDKGNHGKGHNNPAPPTSPEQQAYDANLQKWQDSGLDNYSFTLQRECFCFGDVTRPVNIDVQNGKIASASFADTGEPVDGFDLNSLTVDDLFKQIDTALKSGAAQVNVQYDPTYGFPTSIYIDQDVMIADEEVSLSVSNFSNNDIVFTTLALGEEDGGGISPQPPILTTQALGEEDGGGISPEEPPILTTQAVGEEDGGGISPEESPIATTLALGEEDGGNTPVGYW